MSETYVISQQQKMFCNYVNMVVDLLKQIKFDDEGTNSQLWELLHKPMRLQTLIKNKQCKENILTLQGLIDTLRQLEQMLVDIIEHQPLKKRIWRWITNKTLGTLDQLRIDIENQFKVKRVFLKSYDFKLIDCMFIFGDTQNQQNDQINQNESTSTFIYCNPNGGYYENIFYNSDWIEFYIRKGINLLIWNYRGYGCSEGSPNTIDLLKDCECIVDYLRKELNQKKIGIHGQSIGGMIATYVAYSKNLDFLIADRTFSQLSEIAFHLFGNKAQKLFQFLTNWDFQVNSSYLNTQCYKIISLDVKDDVIPYQASLQNGVSKQFAFNHQNTQDYQNIQKHDYGGMLTQVKHYFISKKYQYSKLLQRNVNPTLENQIQKTIQIKDFNSLYNSIRRIMDIILEISKFRTIEKNQSVNSSFNDETIRSNRSLSAQESKKTKNLNDISINAYENKNNLNESVNLTFDASVVENQEIVSSARSNKIEIESELQQQQNSQQKEIQNDFQYSYNGILTEDIKSDKIFQDFIINCFSILDKFDAGGLPLASIFTVFSQNQQYDIFKLFMLNLDVWGSIKPQKFVLRKKLNVIGYQKYSIIKMKELIQKLKDLTIQIKLHDHEIFQRKLVHDIENICQKFQFVINKIAQKLLIDEVSTFSGDSFKEEEQNYTQQEIKIQKQLGFLLPLECGHNGIYSKLEFKLYELHLKQSGFI